MDKKEILAGMTVRELQDVIYEKKEQEAIEKFSTKKEAQFNIKEVKSLKAEGSGSLFRVRVEDGCEGWEALVEVDRSVREDDEWSGDEEELVKNHIINFMMENDYYEPGDIEEVTVEEMCRYSRPIFKITK